VILPSAAGCLERNTWICGQYLSTRSNDILSALRTHVIITVVSVLIGLVLALPMALLVRRFRRLEGVVLGTTSVLYTIPSVALFTLLVPFTGLTSRTVEVGLVLYSLVILVRNTLTGLDGVPADVREAARGMGFGPVRTLLRVDLPLALPTIVAGLRIATVSTIALVTVGAVIGNGGLGNLIADAFSSDFKAEVLTASVLCVALAVVADLLLTAIQYLVTPWRRSPR
jgi:osmoprotectant transport system permease protein